MKCETCRFFQATDPWTGECRRRAPDNSGWGTVNTKDWCGEYEPKPDETAVTMSYADQCSKKD